MRLSRRLVIYLVLNIVVSAATTLAVLFWWDANHRSPLTAGAPPLASNPPSGTESAPAAAVQSTLPPVGKAIIEIKNVFGIGDLKNEVVVIQRVGEDDLFISGWELEDEDGNRYRFPDLLLNPGGAVQVYSRSGADTVNELYWGAQKPLWRSGEVVTLVDTQGNARASYSIP